MIKEEAQKLTESVELLVFTSKSRKEESEYMIQTLELYKNNSNGNLTIIEYKIEEASDIITKFDIQNTPAILLINEKGEEIIRYLAVPTGAEIRPFVSTLRIFSGAPNYYEPLVGKYLDGIKPTTMQVMITASCAFCPEILSICSQFVLASEGKIKLRVIDLNAHPDIGEKYGIPSVPYVIINDKKPLIGNVGAEQIINHLIDEDL
jgi:thioredoxin reductase (NADPH)